MSSDGRVGEISVALRKHRLNGPMQLQSVTHHLPVLSLILAPLPPIEIRAITPWDGEVRMDMAVNRIPVRDWDPTYIRTFRRRTEVHFKTLLC